MPQITKYIGTPLTPETRKHLLDRKIHPRETWNDIIVRLILVHDQYNEMTNQQ